MCEKTTSKYIDKERIRLKISNLLSSWSCAVELWKKVKEEDDGSNEKTLNYMKSEMTYAYETFSEAKDLMDKYQKYFYDFTTRGEKIFIEELELQTAKMLDIQKGLEKITKSKMTELDPFSEMDLDEIVKKIVEYSFSLVNDCQERIFKNHEITIEAERFGHSLYARVSVKHEGKSFEVFYYDSFNGLLKLRRGSWMYYLSGLVDKRNTVENLFFEKSKNDFAPFDDSHIFPNGKRFPGNDQN